MLPIRTRIIASLGPSSAREGVVEELVLLGVHCFRINFAHGGPDVWRSWVEIVRDVEKRVGKPIALMGDLVGPSIRLGVIREAVRLKPGEKVVFRLGEESAGGEERVAPLPLRAFFEGVEEGDVIVLDDGRARLRVVEARAREIVAEALTEAVLSSRKALVVQGKEFNLPVLGPKDMEHLRFALDHEFDFIALSYVRGPGDVEVVESMVREMGGDAWIVAKIETRRAVENLHAILRRTRTIVVARGDLGMNYGLEEVPFLQKMIVEEARKAGRQVIVATQLLESMIENPVPTRAEVTDVANAVEQGADALMLTGETSIGKYPVEAVKWLRKIIGYTEAHTIPRKVVPRGERWAYANSIVSLAEALNAKLLVFTLGGTLPPYISLSRPRIPAYIGVGNMKTARKLQIMWGLDVHIVEAKGYEEGLEKLEQKLFEVGEITLGDTIVEAYRAEEGGDHVILIKKLLRPPTQQKSVEEKE